MLLKQFCQLGMIRPKEAIEALFMACMIDGISGDGMAVARDRDGGRLVLLPVEIADKTADIAEKRRDSIMLRHFAGHFSHTDVDGDMLIKQGAIDAQIDILWNAV